MSKDKDRRRIFKGLEMDVGNSHEIAFSMTIQRDFQRQSLKSSLRHILLRGTKRLKSVMPKSREILAFIAQQRCHYENTSMQYTAIFHGSKNESEAVLTSTHNLCFKAKI